MTQEDFHRLFEQIERLIALPKGERLDHSRLVVDEFGSAAITYVQAAMKLGALTLEHKVLLIHGIRDDGDWFDGVSKALGTIELLTVHQGGYGFFELQHFLLSESKREGAYEQVLRALRNAQGPMCAVSVIAHSFGTYLVTRALSEHADIRPFRLVLCGGIVSRQFRWDLIQTRLPRGRVLNECGNDDIWPIVARRRSATLFGDTGRFGFHCEPVRDRFHNVGHSGFFDEAFIKKFWEPFFARGDLEVDSGVPKRDAQGLVRILAGRI